MKKQYLSQTGEAKKRNQRKYKQSEKGRLNGRIWQREFLRANPRIRLNRRYKAVYGITRDEADVIIATQNGCCVICGKDPSTMFKGKSARLHVDHDHVTGKLRQMLCCLCNLVIGCAKDDPAVLHRAANYVENWKVKHAS